MSNVCYLGNGWALMGAAEALTALDLFPSLRNTPIYNELLTNFQNHAGNLSLLQSDVDGRFHNILDDPDTFTETSSTAMILTAFLRGAYAGWLDGNAIMQPIHRAWIGLKSAIGINMLKAFTQQFVFRSRNLLRRSNRFY
jgi:unsaturated rhamnogalacturonyl hydrolase